jgi:DNA polymerase III epsilon subunit
MEKLIVFDIETTGLYPEEGARILEIGAVPIVDDRLVEEQNFESLINPGIPIPREVTRIHGIDDAMVRDASPLEVVLPLFLEYIGGYTLVAHNASFDVGFLNFYMNRMGLGKIENRVIDTLQISKRVFAGEGRHNLDSLLTRLGIKYPKHSRHRSITDALLTAQAYLLLKTLAG